jgi:DNA-directed RNA polymerase specialized sigma24 family protein
MFSVPLIISSQRCGVVNYPDGSGIKLAMSQTPEFSLLQQIQAGNEEALIALHSRYANLVYSVAYRILDDGMSAEEVTQDTFLRLWHKSHRYDPEKGNFVTWLLTLTRRLAIDMLRQRRRQPPPGNPIRGRQCRIVGGSAGGGRR